MDDEKTPQTQDEREETNKSQTKGETTDNSGDRKPTSVIEDANQAAARLEKANKEHRELMEKQEQIYAQQKLGGRSEAGHVSEKPKEETPQEYANKVLHAQIPLK